MLWCLYGPDLSIYILVTRPSCLCAGSRRFNTGILRLINKRTGYRIEKDTSQLYPLNPVTCFLLLLESVTDA